ncbi:MAG: hypothetical protein ACP5JB_02090 [candidate division WOR-3 bacterium]
MPGASPRVVPGLLLQVIPTSTIGQIFTLDLTISTLPVQKTVRQPVYLVPARPKPNSAPRTNPASFAPAPV